MGNMISKSGYYTAKSMGKSTGYMYVGVRGVGRVVVYPFSKIPSIKMPSISMPSFSMPSMPSFSMPSMPSFSMPKMSMPNIGFPKFKGMFTGGLRKRFKLGKNEVQGKIASLETEIRNLYLDIGKLGSDNKQDGKLFQHPDVKVKIEKIKKAEAELHSLQNYLANLPANRPVDQPARKMVVRTKPTATQKVNKRVRSLSAAAIRKARFPVKSDAIVFKKSMNDLVDEDKDIRRLAISELGRIGNKAANPVLKEMLRLQDPQILAETINSLIQIDDGDVFKICKSYVTHSNAGVRAACIRGLYKKGQSSAVPQLTESLKDENAEIRSSAAMFLGWLEAKTAVPGLLQVAKDLDKRVSKNAILSLTAIRDEAAVMPLLRLLDNDDLEMRDKIHSAIERILGEKIDFNPTATKEERSRSIDKLKDWWMDKNSPGPLNLKEEEKVAPTPAKVEKVVPPEPKPEPKKEVKAPEPKKVEPVKAPEPKKEIKVEKPEKVEAPAPAKADVKIDSKASSSSKTNRADRIARLQRLEAKSKEKRDNNDSGSKKDRRTK